MSSSIIVVGAGHAAGQLVVSLRQGGFGGKIQLIGEEPYPPYQRPPLSKKYLAGELDRERLYLRPEKFYAEHDVELLLGTRVETLDPGRRAIRLSSGEHLPYDRLVLATGSEVRRLELPGRDLPGVHYLRSIADVDGIREGFRPGAKMVIVGAGYIGLEVAAVAVSAGLDVTVLELADRVMGRVVTREVSKFYAGVHRDAGVRLALSAPPPARFTGDERVRAVLDTHGREYPADLVVVGIGVVPRTELAAAAGIDCEDGILVDEVCQTSDPAILAIGDCTRHPNPLLGCHLRLESVHNAQEQAKTAAASLCGERRPYAQIPWFWSDQYDLKLQIAGMANDSDRTILRGDPQSRSFAVFCARENRLVAIEAVNSAREFIWSKKLIATAAPIDLDSLADPRMNFKELAESALA